MNRSISAKGNSRRSAPDDSSCCVNPDQFAMRRWSILPGETTRPDAARRPHLAGHDLTLRPSYAGVGTRQSGDRVRQPFR